MAPYTIGVHHFPACLMNENNLRFIPESEYSCMSQTILGLEIEFIQDVVMGHMAIVTMGFLTVGTVIPCGILRSHNVAVNTCFRLVAKI